MSLPPCFRRGTLRLEARGDLDDVPLKQWAKSQPYTHRSEQFNIFRQDAKTIAGGTAHSLAVDGLGQVWGWGENEWYQLGTVAEADVSVPRQVEGFERIVAVAAGASHSLALDDQGQVWGVGSNEYGEIGGLNWYVSSDPVQVTALTGLVNVAAGGYHSLALDNQGRVWAWGDNAYFQLGAEVPAETNIPVQVGNLTGASATLPGQAQGTIAAGFRHALALRADLSAAAWGDNTCGQLGDGHSSSYPTPTLYTP